MLATLLCTALAAALLLASRQEARQLQEVRARLVSDVEIRDRIDRIARGLVELNAPAEMSSPAEILRRRALLGSALVALPQLTAGLGLDPGSHQAMLRAVDGATAALNDPAGPPDNLAGLRRGFDDVSGRLRARRKPLQDEVARLLNRERLLREAGVVVALGLLSCALLAARSAWHRARRAEDNQRRSDGRLRASLDSLSQGVALFGPDHRLRDWNACFAGLLELPSSVLRPGVPIGAILDAAMPKLSGGDGSPLAALLTPLQAGLVGAATVGGAAPDIWECEGPGGRVLEVRRTLVAGGAGFVLTLSDMTVRVRSTQMLRDAQKMQAVGQLSSGLAHDFNNLLTVILCNLEAVRDELVPGSDGHDDPAARALAGRLDQAVQAARRGGTLTRQLLSFARRQPLEPASLDLNEVLPELVPLLRRTLGPRVQVLFEPTPGLWPINADRAQLDSAVLNLALNSRDAMPGGGRLTFELANVPVPPEGADGTAREFVRLRVSDTGHGMTPEVAARAFEPFFTTKPPPGDGGGGSGLGLAMLAAFVRQGGGSAAIRSSPGAGTCVEILLPRLLAVPVIPVPLTDAIPARRHGAGTILVVEDDPSLREMVTVTLRSLGYRAIDAADAAEAMRLLSALGGPLDLLLTDIGLPGACDGRELAERILTLRPWAGVLLMSGRGDGDPADAATGAAGPAGGVGGARFPVLGKPFRRDDLARAVAAAMPPPAGVAA
ncbi:ATP-binding protein [Rhizosaccharibacter radicis]|uniref:histidine kinase n=1 Tax=Rhizosaccharibacter radicis TaxID=2782605 RepID=A0ABT1W052_9PROT|nr:ATP-binding protein [Acetobacteraceae bacterium KSS12]